MNRSDFQDSYDDDDDDDSCSESSSSKKYSLFVEETETNECVNDEKLNRKHRGKNDNQVETREESSYSSVIMANTRRYKDVSTRNLKKTPTDDVYSFDNQFLQSEDEHKSGRTRETKKRKGMVKSPITVQTFFKDASPNGNNSNEDGIYSKTPAYGNKKSKVETKSRKENKLQKRMVDDEENDPIEISDIDKVQNVQRKRKLQNDKVQSNNKFSRKKSRLDTQSSIKDTTTKVNCREHKSSAKVRNFKHEVYVTENENEDSMHQETDYSHDSLAIRNRLLSDYSQDSGPHSNATANKQVNSRRRNTKSKQQQNYKSTDGDEWCDEDQENFLHTLRDQPIHELTEKSDIQLSLFAKRLEELGTYKTPEECKKQVSTVEISHSQCLCLCHCWLCERTTRPTMNTNLIDCYTWKLQQIYFETLEMCYNTFQWNGIYKVQCIAI